MSSKKDQKNSINEESNKTPDKKQIPTEPTNEEFEQMTDEEVIDFAERLGIKFAERFPEKKAVIRIIKRFYAEEKFRPTVNFNRITEDTLKCLKKTLIINMKN